MRRIIASTNTTLDGYIDNPHEWSMQYNDPGAQRYALDLTLGAGALLLGRVTYEGMAQAWPHMGGNPYSDHVNGIEKYVVASEQVDVEAWGPATVIAGDDVLDTVGRLKQTDGDDVLIWGNGRLTDTLATAGLLDEYRIWVYPVIKGGGEPLFRAESRASLEHIDTTTFASGVVVLSYRVSAA
ncbi:dihydrofolate reductase family protein [Nocardia brevicatena]|uniref:dihydrofolate reductase family protein n=1 Tax=Nocardia brevicatena TaxID=37327 RepID=UPI00031AF25A|nr:dihydrofolate reductase family protein [Nocardia brevicatena]